MAFSKTLLASRSLFSSPSSSRSFSFSPFFFSLNKNNKQRLKKASDVEAKTKEKVSLRSFTPPPRKSSAAAAPPSIEDAMTQEQLERWRERRPVDDVWLSQHYPERVFGLDAIVEMHRQANDPSMLDNPEGDLFVDLSLNMGGLKQTKPLKSFAVLTHIPHLSAHTIVEPRYVAVLVKNPDLQLQLAAKGATYIGAEDLIAKIKSGSLLRDSDFDYLIAHMDIVRELTQLKKKFPGELPSESMGTLGVDIHAMFDLHQNGYLLRVKADAADPYVGSTTFSLGKLSHSRDQMMDNLGTIVQILRRKRPANLTAKRGPFVTGALLRAPPNKEVFKWNFDALNEFIDSADDDLKNLRLGV